MKPTLHIVVLLAASIAVALLADAWRSARHDSQQLAATLAAQNTVIQQSADREKQRDSQLAAIQAQKHAVQSPQQAAKQLPSVLPPLPLPVSIHDPDLSVPLPPGEAPSTTISIPQPDLVPLVNLYLESGSVQSRLLFSFQAAPSSCPSPWTFLQPRNLNPKVRALP